MIGNVPDTVFSEHRPENDFSAALPVSRTLRTVRRPNSQSLQQHGIEGNPNQ